MNKLVAPSIEINAHRAAVPGLRQPHETLDAVRHADERVHRLAVLGARKLQGDREAEIGNEREGMRRVDGERREQRKDVGEKIIFEPGLLGFAHVGAIDERNSGLCQSRAQLEPLRLLVLDQEHDRLGNARKLLGRGQALGALGADAGPDLRPETGDAHHEKLIEVVRRDRQEPQPLQQRVAAVGGFLEHAPVEIEPGELAVNETFRTRGDRRLGVTPRRLGEARGRLQPPLRVGFERNDSRLGAVDHGSP